MFALPKEINKIIKTIEGSGFQAYVVGGSVRDGLMGLKPEDWDLASNAPMEIVLKLFPHAITIGEKYGVVQVTSGQITADVAAMRIDGDYTDYRRPDNVTFTDQIEEDLKRRDFTINGMAFHPERGLIDPLGGQNDLRNRLIRTIGDPQERFSQDPLRILRGIRFAGQLDFDLSMETFSAMQKTASLLERISMDRRRQEFEKLILTENAAKALRICVSTDIMPAIFGDSYPPKGKQDNGDLSVLIQNLNKSSRQLDLRMALLLLCFEKQKALKIVEEMNYSGDMANKLVAAQNLMMDLYFATDKYSIKRLIYQQGEGIYHFLDNVAKQMRNVYDMPGYRIESRYYILDEIRKSKEPIFIDHLEINGKDLIEAGIAEGEQVGQLLNMLIEVVHKYPGLNTKTKLLKKAKELKKPWKAKFRNIHFIR